MFRTAELLPDDVLHRVAAEAAAGEEALEARAGAGGLLAGAGLPAGGGGARQVQLRGPLALHHLRDRRAGDVLVHPLRPQLLPQAVHPVRPQAHPVAHEALGERRVVHHAQPVQALHGGGGHVLVEPLPLQPALQLHRGAGAVGEERERRVARFPGLVLRLELGES